MPLGKTCYWCGGKASSVDHVPPKSIFPKTKRNNLITVPACDAHNQHLGKFDEKFRFYLQARGTNPDALQELRTTTYRGLTNPKAPGLAKGLARGSVRINLGSAFTYALRIDPQEQNLYFEKIIRGLYFHVVGGPAGGQVLSFSKDFMMPGLDYVELYSLLNEYLNDAAFMTVGQVANPDIFRFRYGRAQENGHEIFVVAMLFYQGVEVIGWLQK